MDLNVLPDAVTGERDMGRIVAGVTTNLIGHLRTQPSAAIICHTAVPAFVPMPVDEAMRQPGTGGQEVPVGYATRFRARYTGFENTGATT